MMSVLLIAAVRMPHMVLASTSLAMEQEKKLCINGYSQLYRDTHTLQYQTTSE